MYPATQNLSAFVTVAHCKQFKQAASHLNLTESAVSHQISRLEAQLDVRLFERSRKGVDLTEAGRIFLKYAETALREIEIGVAAVNGQNETRLSISAPRTFAAMWLAPRIPEFAAVHPEVELQITATDRLSDLHHEAVDIAFRVTNMVWDEYTQMSFCEEILTPLASPKYADKIAQMEWAEIVKDIPFIINETHPDEWDIWSEVTSLPVPKHKKYRALQSYDLVQSAAMRDFGIAMGRSPLCDDAISDGYLVKICPDHIARSASYDILYRKDRRLKHAAKNFLNWLG